MDIDYSTILKIDRMRPQLGGSESLWSASENDRCNILFSPAFRRLQQHGQVFPLGAGVTARSKLSHALEVAQVGRAIAAQAALQLERENLATQVECTALVNFTEAACLARDIGSPPFGRAGEAAIQRWFADHGSAKLRAACKTPSGRELDGTDPRLLNALQDFYEFDRNPQGLRVLAKLHWNNDSRGLNLTKTSIASYVQYGRMTGERSRESGNSSDHFSDKPGFFSTEAGLIKNIWSTFSYNTEPRHFPLSYIVAAADDIVTYVSDLEETISVDLLRPKEVIHSVREEWLSTYIPVDPDTADAQILEMLNDAAEGKDRNGNDFGFADLRRGLISTLSQFAARHYLLQHEAVFAGTIDTLLPPESGAGAIVAILKKHCQKYVYGLDSVEHNELLGYSVVHGLLDRFGALLACPYSRIEPALGPSAAQTDTRASFGIERQLLALIPAHYRSAYAQLVAQLGDARGRDEEFEEWNTRAHLVVDFIAGMTESAASATFQTLSGRAFGERSTH